MHSTAPNPADHVEIEKGAILSTFREEESSRTRESTILDASLNLIRKIPLLRHLWVTDRLFPDDVTFGSDGKPTTAKDSKFKIISAPNNGVSSDALERAFGSGVIHSLKGNQSLNVNGIASATITSNREASEKLLEGYGYTGGDSTDKDWTNAIGLRGLVNTWERSIGDNNPCNLGENKYLPYNLGIKDVKKFLADLNAAGVTTNSTNGPNSQLEAKVGYICDNIGGLEVRKKQITLPDGRAKEVNIPIALDYIREDLRTRIISDTNAEIIRTEGDREIYKPLISEVSEKRKRELFAELDRSDSRNVLERLKEAEKRRRVNDNTKDKNTDIPDGYFDDELFEILLDQISMGIFIDEVIRVAVAHNPPPSLGDYDIPRRLNADDPTKRLLTSHEPAERTSPQTEGHHVRPGEVIITPEPEYPEAGKVTSGEVIITPAPLGSTLEIVNSFKLIRDKSRNIRELLSLTNVEEHNRIAELYNSHAVEAATVFRNKQEFLDLGSSQQSGSYIKAKHILRENISDRILDLWRSQDNADHSKPMNTVVDVHSEHDRKLSSKLIADILIAKLLPQLVEDAKENARRRSETSGKKPSGINEVIEDDDGLE